MARKRALSEGGFRLNVARVPLAKARQYAESIFKKNGIKGMARSISLDEALPDFDRNYARLQTKLKRALSIPRVQMPVIEPQDMKDFQKRLSEGYIDLFAPYAKGAWKGVPAAWGPMDKDEGDEWVTLGVQDGDPNDDKVQAKWGKTQAKALLPTQNEIWLEKLIVNTAKFGLPSAGSFLTKQTVIVSAEGYILDGHHRFGQLMIADPKIAIASLNIGLDIDELLDVGRAYGAAIGREPKASLVDQVIRLAHEKPALRKDLLPLLQGEAGSKKR